MPLVQPFSMVVLLILSFLQYLNFALMKEELSKYIQYTCTSYEYYTLAPVFCSFDPIYVENLRSKLFLVSSKICQDRLNFMSLGVRRLRQGSHTTVPLT
jgi:hypothetical protein